MRRTPLPPLSAVAVLIPLVPLVPFGQGRAAADTRPAAEAPALAVANPGFEQGAYGWTFTAGTGVATDEPRTGTRLLHLDGEAGGPAGR